MAVATITSFLRVEGDHAHLRYITDQFSIRGKALEKRAIWSSEYA
jgi:hypothetical protein